MIYTISSDPRGGGSRPLSAMSWPDFGLACYTGYVRCINCDNNRITIVKRRTFPHDEKVDKVFCLARAASQSDIIWGLFKRQPFRFEKDVLANPPQNIHVLASICPIRTFQAFLSKQSGNGEKMVIYARKSTFSVSRR